MPGGLYALYALGSFPYTLFGVFSIRLNVDWLYVFTVVYRQIVIIADMAMNPGRNPLL